MRAGPGGAAALRILFHTLHFSPDPARVDWRGGDLLTWLAGRGHAVEAIAGVPHDGAGRIAPGYRGWRWRDGVSGDVRVTYCPLRPAPYSTGLARNFQNLSFALTSAPCLMQRALRAPPQVIGALAPPPAAIPAVLGAARLAGVPAWLHLIEGEPIPRTGVAALLRRRFDIVSMAALDAEAKLSALDVAPEKRLALPPWIDTRLIFPQNAEPNRLREGLYFDSDAIVALYVGSLDDQRVVASLIEAARHVPQNGAIAFAVCGIGAGRREIATAARHLPPLHLLPWLPRARLNELLNLADVHLLPQGLAATDPLLPAKTLALLASGRPIVAAMRSQAQGLASSEAVIAVAPDDGAALAYAVVQLAASSAERQRRGTAARRHAQDYHEKERVLRQLERALMERLPAVAVSAA